jgi:hypothetical protein
LSPNRHSTRAGERLDLIISDGRLLDASVPPGTFQSVRKELESIYGRGYLADKTVLRELGWMYEEDNQYQYETYIFQDAPGILSAATFDVGYTKPRELLDRLGPKAEAMGLSRIPGFIPGAPFDHVGYRGSAADLAESLRRAGIRADVREHRFTRDEHAVLSAYFQIWPDEAVESLGSSRLPENVVAAYASQLESSGTLQSAVAAIVLRTIARKLPWSEPVSKEYPGGSRWGRPRSAYKEPVIQPIRALAIEWPGSMASWPARYYLSWVPVYKRYVVTYSVDWEPGDVAIHHFAANAGRLRGLKRAITSHWNSFRYEYDQEPWERAETTELVSAEVAKAWADEVWPPPEDEYEEDFDSGEDE